MEKENFVISKLRKSQPQSGKIRIGAVNFWMVTPRVLSKITNLETVCLLKKLCFLDNFSQKIRMNDVFAQTQGHKNTQGMLKVFRTRTREAIFRVMRVVVNYHRGQNQKKNTALH